MRLYNIRHKKTGRVLTGAFRGHSAHKIVYYFEVNDPPQPYDWVHDVIGILPEGEIPIDEFELLHYDTVPAKPNSSIKTILNKINQKRVFNKLKYD